MLKEKFSFKVLKEDGLARVGKINTHRGEIDTPTFMPVGTQGTIKSVFMEDVVSTGVQIILSGFDTVPFEPSPLFIISTNSIPLTTFPKTVYCRSR